MFGSILVGVICFGAGMLVTVMFSKNNKNTIAKARQEILDAVVQGRHAVEQVLNKHS